MSGLAHHAGALVVGYGLTLALSRCAGRPAPRGAHPDRHTPASVARALSRPASGRTQALRLLGRAQVAAQLRRQREDQRLLGGVHRLRVGVAPLGEERQHAVDQVLGHRGARGDADRVDALEPGLLDLAGVVHAVGRLGAGLERDLDQAHRVGGVAGADHDHQVGRRRRSP